MSNELIVTCDYCGEKASLVSGSYVYPHRSDLSKLSFWFCNNDHEKAYVGCHKGTLDPLGRLANARLRRAKSLAHRTFDPLWKNNPKVSRSKAYKWLASALDIEPSKCHIGMFDEGLCRRVVEVCFLNETMKT